MPAPAAARQPERSASGWFSTALAQRLLRVEQRRTLPLLTACYGRTGLYLRCERSAPEELSGNMLQRVLRLYRRANVLDGDLVCRDDELPLQRESVDLVFLLHALEAGAAPRALLHELERVLAPEGTLLLVGLNPYSLWRLRWIGSGLHAIGAARCAASLRDAGFEPTRVTGVGPVLPWLRDAEGFAGGESGGFDPWAVWRASYVIQARKRRATLTPLRPRAAAVAFEHGMRTG